MNHYSLTPVGTIISPYKEKFAVPRQPSLVPSARAQLKLVGEANTPLTVEGLEQFSHLWILFLFDQNIEQGWKSRVRPPRLGGNQRIGVFASRATFRPNHIGMSLVELKRVNTQGDDVILDLGGVDLVDGTPVIDIKPYIPYADSVANARGGYAQQQPATLPVTFSSPAEQILLQADDGAHQRQVIEEVLAQDPRPAYKQQQISDKQYGVHLFDYNVMFSVGQDGVSVDAITPLAIKD